MCIRDRLVIESIYAKTVVINDVQEKDNKAWVDFDSASVKALEIEPVSYTHLESIVLPKSKVLHKPKVKAAMITQALPPVAVFRIQPAISTPNSRP